MLKFFTLCFLSFLSQLTYSVPITLNATEKTLEINGKPLKVYDLEQPNHQRGFVGTKGEWFDVILRNQTQGPISVHWHGMILPNAQDGVPYVTQLPIEPGHQKHYRFKLLQAGTFWMHSHYKFNEQSLMAAPLILKDPKDKYAKDKDVVVMFESVTFQNPETILFNLQHKKNMTMKMQMGKSNAPPDLNDVNFDAYIANRKTLAHPEIVTVKPEEKIRLRLINASTANNFWISTGMQGTAIAVDGNDIQPFSDTHFQIAIAQRMDIEVTIPKEGGAFPILAQVEGTKHQSGIILATKNAKIPKLSEEAAQVMPALNDTQEKRLHAKEPLAKKPVQSVLQYKLTGDMQKYIWKINDEVWPRIKPLKVKKGDRVEMVFVNDTNMAHPMHLHGHIFQVTEINGVPLENGPVRDTILVLPHSTKKIVLDANNPGIWMLHCHVLYHMSAGMMTTTNYRDYPEPEFYQKLIKGLPE